MTADLLVDVCIEPEQTKRVVRAMQKNPTRHHFVPRFLLQNFTDPAGGLWVYDAKRKKKWKSNPHSAGYEKNLHTITREDGIIDKKTIEERVTKLYDTPGYGAVKELIKRECLDPVRWVDFIKFVAALMVRTPKAILQIQEIGTPIMTEMASRIVASNHEFRDNVTRELLDGGATPMDIKNILDSLANRKIAVIPHRDFVLIQNLLVIESLSSGLLEMNWMFCSVDTSEPDLIIGDHPVLLEDIGHQYERGPLGISNPNIEIVLPLSKRMAAVANWTCEPSYGTLLPGMAAIINDRSMQLCNGFIYASEGSKELLDKLISLHGTGPKIKV